MKEQGIVRRIDDLGRIVIPKEIRKRLNIDNGDLLDIILNDNHITLKKYSPINEVPTNFKLFLDSLLTIFPYRYIILDKEKIIYSSYDNLINTSSSLLYNKIKSNNIDSITLDESYSSYVININNHSDIYGYVIIIDNIITQKHKDFGHLIVSYLNKII